ncbi:hypothetical protein F4810DRAFT_649849 [Camillea tinctor]|nr:hypothetical protein F4810DRAFT_649849 [Camillea tinctor]
MASIATETLEFIIHNVFLPPKLPQSGDDIDNASCETVLLDIVIKALSQFSSHVHRTHRDSIQSAQKGIEIFRELRGNTEWIIEEKLAKSLGQLATDEDGSFPLHVTAQNAGIIVSCDETQVQFESFELSPRNKDVMGTKGRLRRSFPASSVSIPIERFSEELRLAIAHTIAKMSYQDAEETKPTVRKKGKLQIEEKDTTDPFLVTDFLFTVLQTVGEAKEPSVIWKNTREEVLWKDAKLPWRRSPLWLLIRVALQIHLNRPTPHNIYKEFMVFLMAIILELALKEELPSDSLYCMLAKIEKRLIKLDKGNEYPWLQVVRNILDSTWDKLEARWKEISKSADHILDMTNLSKPISKDETHDSYPDLDAFIDKISRRQKCVTAGGFRAPWTAPIFGESQLPVLEDEDRTSEELQFKLLAFEEWIKSSLGNWIESHLTEEETCTNLCTLMESYHNHAEPCYRNSPESLSIMILIVLELWVACDKSACARKALLSQYKPEIPYELLQSLILYSSNHLERLSKVENYIDERNERSCRVESVLSSFGEPGSFSVQFYATSDSHQRLRYVIENEAKQSKENKKTELLQKKQDYYDLIDSASRMSHSYFENRWGASYHNSSWCEKCVTNKKAQDLTIFIHEWPLPNDELETQSTVFELEVPGWFNSWRNATVFIIHDVLKYRYSGSPPEYLESLYSYMSLYYEGDCRHYSIMDRRLELSSATKSNLRAHRNCKYVSTATEEQILLQNGLNYAFYDSRSRCLVSSPERTDNIPRQCMYELSKENESLQDFIFRPAGRENGLTPNEVLSEQFSCSQSLSLGEFKAMATLPIGYHLQWTNILVQLSSPTVDFNKPDTALIMMQIVHQVGLPSECPRYRASHESLNNEVFTKKLVQVLFLQLKRIERNWESYVALKVFICIAIKALSVLDPSNRLAQEYIKFLQKCRATATKWIYELQVKESNTYDDRQREEFFAIISQISLICISSFDIEQFHLMNLLLQETQVKCLIECAIIVKSLSFSVGEPLDPISIGLTLQAKRVLYKAHEILIREILDSKNKGLDEAIKRTLNSFTRGDEWKRLSDTEYHWLETKDLKNSSIYHVNLLNGEFLANGLPPSRLPSEYENHQNFETLFGRAMIKVAPSSDPGMRFSALKKYQEHNLLFGIDDVDLLLVASKDARELDLIPQRAFDKLPASFVHDYVHWYDHTSKTVEFRPKEQPWVACPTNWVLRKIDSSWELQKQGESLIGSRSPKAKFLQEILSSLENKRYMHLIINDTTGVIKVDMPRLRLQFSLSPESSKLECRQFRGMYVDETQGIGTLVGLQSKLTLRDGHRNRKVLIPSGSVRYFQSSQHVGVQIQHDNSTRIHPYDLDTRLGRLVDNGSLASKLTLAYLHALTSFCLPNELTSKTGTEECLSILRSAAVRSFPTLSSEDLNILASISKLSPERRYYRDHMKVMETIKWDSTLSFLSQDVYLNFEVKSIVEAAVFTQFFYPDSAIKIPKLQYVDENLESRHRVRESAFHVSGYGAEDHSASYDVEYPARDRVKREERSNNAYKIASTVFNSSMTLHAPIPQSHNNRLCDQLWCLLTSSDGTWGPNPPLEKDEVSYDSKWLFQMNSFLPRFWCRFHEACRTGKVQPRRLKLMFCLATMAYSEDCDMGAVQVLSAMANITSIGRIEPPDVATFKTTKGYDIKVDELKSIIEDNRAPFDPHISTRSISRELYESWNEYRDRAYGIFSDEQRDAISELLESLQGQWPCESPRERPEAYSSQYFDVTQIMDKISPIWCDWYNNYQLFKYLTETSNQVQRVREQQILPPTFLIHSPSAPVPTKKTKTFINDKDLFDHSISLKDNLLRPGLDLLDGTTHKQENTGKLETLVKFLRQKACPGFESKYLKTLEASKESLRRSRDIIFKLKRTGNELHSELESHLRQCKEHCEEAYNILKREAGSSENVSPGISSASCHMAPRISPSFFLSQLAQARWEYLSEDWRKAVVAYARSLTMVQRAERMLYQEHDEAALVKELENPGHTNWDPIDYPESLLLEVESGIMIRDVQEDIAKLMRNPSGHKNAVMQLNMGEGKSSVIVPIVAAHLADRKRLVRVIVAKPQAKELLRTLISKLGGLLDHQIYHMPFSRSLQLKSSDAEAVLALSTKCLEKGGILLVQPEHLLSFQLMGIENQLNAKEDVGRIILNSHQNFHNCSRDLVDESDENFNVKFELIYTMGTQTPIEFSPERWSFIQSVLGIVMSVVDEVREEFPESIDVTSRIQGQFPRIRLLRKDAEECLLALVADKIFQFGLRGFPINRQAEEVRASIRKYVLSKDLSATDVKDIDQSGFFTESFKEFLLLLRGLLAEGVLGFALREKRWRVNYGLDLDRKPETKLAVPYRAKDNPTARSEFSHPDAVIVLTCLSYYYGGLSNEDLFMAFDHLRRMDNAPVEYQVWVQDAPNLPGPFRNLGGVTTKDQQQLTGEIFPHLCKSKSTIDYFLSHIVFSREMKEFPQKLSASGWDIGRVKKHPTTGFSGTCDSQELLPLDMEHQDLESQRHTNALVLEYILQEENDVVKMSRSNYANHSNAEELLDLAVKQEPPVQVILDVGAQILEMTNVEVARAWLDKIPKDHEKEAVVFFDDADDLCVLDHQGCVEKLQTSPYYRQLDLCLVFLDEAHTRGTDLKLPEHYRAIVTLGAGLTKDRLVQACMRMRKLGHGQSVIFSVSEEIASKITSLKGTTNDLDIKVSDVLAWTIWETFADLRRSIPIWALQGKRFEDQKAIWESVTEGNKILMSREKAEGFLEKEAQSLEDRYKPKVQGSEEESIHASLSNPYGNPRLDEIRNRCDEFGIREFRSSLLSEEQERELSPEKVQERQIERPPQVDPAKHIINQDVVSLVKFGSFTRSAVFQPAFQALKNTKASRTQNIDLSSFPDDVLVTEDFVRTVKLVGYDAQADCYQRSVQWILKRTSPDAQHLIIISPHEAQELMLDIKSSKHVYLHVYAPLPNLDYKPLDDLQLYVVPRLRTPWKPSTHQRLLLNLFSGQLNFSSYDDYVETCRMMCLATAPTAKGFEVEPDGFIVSTPNNETLRFRQSPVKFLRSFLMAIRQQGDGNEKTHWGRILGGEILEKQRDANAII